MALAPGQRTVLRAFTRASQTSGASPKVRKALLEAGLTESNLQNLSYGDRDSLGPLQQRPSSGYKHPNNPYLAALDFIKQAQPIAGKYGSAGQLAQAVQRSAFPARYDQRGAQADALLHGSGGGAPSAPQSPTPSAYGGDSRQQIALSLLGLGGLAGGSYGGGGDPLTSALLQATQQGGKGPAIPHGPQPTGSDITAIASRASQINREHLPYQWGGGHGSAPAGPGVPLDCSGAVSRLLNVSPRVSGDYTKFGQSGPGKSLTIYANGHHVLMEINGHFWGTSGTNPGGGAGWIPRSAISPGYLKGFVARHPAGM